MGTNTDFYRSSGPGPPPVRDLIQKLNMRPCTIWFTKRRMGDVRKKDGQTFLETALEVVKQDPHFRDKFPLLKVVVYKGLHRCLENRRLAVFRVLEMAGHCRSLLVEVVDLDMAENADKRREFEKVFTK